MKEISSTKNTLTSRKQFEMNQKIKNQLAGISNIEQNLTDQNVINESYRNQEILESVNLINQKKSEKRKKVNNMNLFIENTIRQNQTNLLKDIIYNAIPLNNKLKEENHSEIVNKITTVLEEISENYESTSVLVTEMLDNIEAHVKEVSIVREASEIKNLNESLEDMNNHNNDIVSKSLRGKLKKVIDFELNESNDDNSLFMTIQTENVKEVLKANRLTEINKTVLNTALAESIIDYSILESLNTLGLVEYDLVKLKNSKNAINVVNEELKRSTSDHTYILNESNDFGEITQKTLKETSIYSLNVPQETDEVQFIIEDSGVRVSFLDSSLSPVTESVMLKDQNILKSFDTKNSLKESFINSNLKNRYFNKTFKLVDITGSTQKL